MLVREKNYGIDALRILSMFMVVGLHIFNAGGVLDATERLIEESFTGLDASLPLFADRVLVTSVGCIWTSFW